MHTIDIDAIMLEIKNKAQQRRHNLFRATSQETTPSSMTINHDTTFELKSASQQILTLPRHIQEKSINNKQSCSLTDFLNFHDEQFIFNAYTGILDRDPDPKGFEHFLAKLRAGELNKIEILGRLRYSQEGRQLSKKIKGLLLPFFVNLIYKIPILGYVMRFTAGLVQLPVILKNFVKFESYVQWQFTREEKLINNDQTVIENYLNRTIQSINTSLERVAFEKADSHSVTELADSVRELADRKADQELLSILKEQLDEINASKVNLKDVEQMQQKLNQLTETVNLVAARKADRALVTILEQKLDEIAARKANIADMEQTRQKITELAEKLQEVKANKADQSMVALLQQELEQMTLLNASMDDEMYVSFENQFRGTRESIKEYQKIYLPYIIEAHAGNKNSPVLDIGCGRGEWLELLKENGYTAKGLDSNRVMIQCCQELGLNAIESDVIEYLTKLPPASIGVITAFHLLEHLPFRIQISLLDESLRVLKSGGLIILETPNPQNLIVGACEFYNDPTHKNPIPPDALKYFVEIRGFNRIKMLKLHRDDEQHLENEWLNTLLCGEKDYAVIGYKELRNCKK